MMIISFSLRPYWLLHNDSDIAFTMGAKGPLLEKAHNYSGNIDRY